MSVRLKQVRNKYIDMVNKNKLSAAAQFTRLVLELDMFFELFFTFAYFLFVVFVRA